VKKRAAPQNLQNMTSTETFEIIVREHYEATVQVRDDAHASRIRRARFGRAPHQHNPMATISKQIDDA
jgi:hypothetical protein